jgi:alkanesulfonate monooxygenase SsuD/methylene tetrahydromethanopterin reductase-like flavin-dependent oxidoreductase (luciferase family)
MSAIDVGVFLPSMSPRDSLPGDVTAAARHAESLGLESVWVVDQLIAGTGVPVIDSFIVLAAAAGATSTIRLGLGVLIAPLRAPVWIAKQVASLQHVSGDRLLLGVGVGGDRHDASWSAAGVPRRERGRRTDELLRVLPDLLAGKPVALVVPGNEIALSPAVTMPPILVGGMSHAAMRRAAEYADGWMLVPITPAEAAAAIDEIGAVAARSGRIPPSVTASVMVAIDGDPAMPDDDAVLNLLTDGDGVYGIPVEHAETTLLRGGPDVIASRIADFAAAGAERIVFTLVAGDWHRQAELLNQARLLFK